MSKVTPVIGTTGTFVLKAPWSTNQGEHYKVVEIKTLDEMSRSNMNPKESIYAKFGLVDGNAGFSWDAEAAANPYILLLSGTKGNLIYVPDTYIESYPDVSVTTYSNFYVSVYLGKMPETEDVTGVAADLADLAMTRTGLQASTNIFTTPPASQPTQAEHKAFLQAREIAFDNPISNYEEIVDLKNENASLRTTNQALIRKLQSHGLL